MTIQFDGKELRRRRVARGLTQNYIAAICGYNTPNPAKAWEEGESEPSFTQTLIICRELECDFRDLDKTEKAVA